MKIKLSKSQWEGIGKKAGWMPTEQDKPLPSAKYLDTGFWEIPEKAAKDVCQGNLPHLGYQKQVSFNGKTYVIQQTPHMGKMVWSIRWKKEDPSADNSLRAKSQKWWGALSINQMKELTKKYYPNVAWSFINETPGLIEDIYQKENHEN